MSRTQKWEPDPEVEAELERTRLEMVTNEGQQRLDQAWADAEAALERAREAQREGGEDA